MKKLIAYSLISLALLFSGCEKELLERTNPNFPTTGSFYDSEEAAIEAINSVYSGLQFFGVYNRYWIYTTSARSDESVFTDKQSGLPEVNGLDDFTMTSTVTAVHESWRDPYMGLLKANMVLENVPDTDMDEELKNRILGEAYFLRGLYHFILIRNFGEEIPMYISVPASGNDFYPESQKPGVIYAQVEADFAEAKKLLPTVNTYRNTENIGRVSKGAATAFLGKTYLFQKKYQAAADEFAEIVTDQVGTYELVPSFRDNHYENENNMESILEIQYELIPETGDVWNIAYENNNAQESQIIEQECTMPDAAGGMWWNQKPSDAMIAEFETSDPRYYKTFWCPDGDTYFEDGREKTYEEYIGARDGDLGWRKWCRDYATGIWYSDVNVRVMRLADVYLMYAECLIEGASGPGTPEQYINLVRDRARNIPGADVYPLTGELPSVEDLIAAAPVINGRRIDNLTAALRHERMVELAFEGKRFEDIVRWGIGQELFGSAFKPWLPIYQGDLDTNPFLKPNSSN